MHAHGQTEPRCENHKQATNVVHEVTDSTHTERRKLTLEQILKRWYQPTNQWGATCIGYNSTRQVQNEAIDNL